MDDVTVAILAGGQSRRMGRNKSFVPVHGVSMIDRVLAAVTPLKVPVLLITSQTEAYARYNLPMFADVIPDCGALGGIYTALSSSQTSYVLCVACDMPFLNTAVLRTFLNHRYQANATAACVDDLWHIFPGVYHTDLAPSLRDFLDKGQLRMQRIMKAFNVFPVPLDEIRVLDPDLLTFTNINTPRELDEIHIPRHQ